MIDSVSMRVESYRVTSHHYDNLAMEAHAITYSLEQRIGEIDD